MTVTLLRAVGRLRGFRRPLSGTDRPDRHCLVPLDDADAPSLPQRPQYSYDAGKLPQEYTVDTYSLNQ